MTIVDKSVERLSMESALRTLLLMEDCGAGNGSLREKLLSLETKLASNQLHLAVLGQMKRGKSSFINALLGTEILPTGVLPVTSVITEIRYGVVPEAAIFYRTGQREKVALSALADYITESANPGNKKRVASVEISYPSPFLEAGIVLIDTPGIGSTHAHNTRTTESYLQQVDAAIVVLSVDPPITKIESQFVKSLKEEIPKLFFLLNKTDLVSADEISDLSCFLRDELTRIQMESPEIFFSVGAPRSRTETGWGQRGFEWNTNVGAAITKLSTGRKGPDSRSLRRDGRITGCSYFEVRRGDRNPCAGLEPTRAG